VSTPAYSSARSASATCSWLHDQADGEVVGAPPRTDADPLFWQAGLDPDGAPS
jgi:hypothetical protein